MSDEDSPGGEGTAGSESLIAAPTPGNPGPSRRVIFFIVAAALFMGSVDLTIVATALHAIHRSLHASINWVGWTITIYGLGTVVALPIFGKFSLQYGRRRIFAIGVTMFTVTSLLCGLSSNIYVLISLRAIQAFGGGAIQPSAAGLIADHYGNERGKAIGFFGVVSAAGQVVGPIAGGILVAYLSWRWIFFVNVPIGVVLLVLTFRRIPKSVERTNTRTDPLGLILMTSGVFCAIFGITMLGNGKTSVVAPVFVVPVTCAVGLLAAFVRHSMRVETPFIPIRLLHGRGFAVMNGINLLHGVVTFGIASLVPLYAEDRYHLSALNAGTLLTSRAIGMIVVGTLAALLLRRTGYRLPMIGGFAVVATGNLLMSVAPRWDISPFLWLSLCVGIAGLGLGAVNPSASNACLHLAPDQVAAITGLRAMFINLGVIISVSVTTAILSRSSDPGIVQAHVLWGAAAIGYLVMIPMIFRVPEHRGSW